MTIYIITLADGQRVEWPASSLDKVTKANGVRVAHARRYGGIGAFRCKRWLTAINEPTCVCTCRGSRR
jgi:hypothetical protein